jgi:hypothetical protein
MNPLIFQMSMAGGFLAWGMLLYLAYPWLAAGGHRRTFTALAAVHLFRYIGLVALVPTMVDPAPFGWTQFYLMQVGYGDFIGGLLAAIAIVAVRREWRSANLWAWLFIVIGTLDTLNAGASIVPAIRDQNLVSVMGWLILTVYVPALVITEAALIYHMVRGRTRMGIPAPMAMKSV